MSTSPPAGTRPPREFHVTDLPANIAAKITVNPVTGCWDWQGYRCPKRGYGFFRWHGRLWRIHRLVYTLLAESVPDKLQLDHVEAWGCVSRACCWPGHLEPVTNAENTRRGNNFVAVNLRKTHCPKQHPYDDKNTLVTPKGHRQCRACQQDKDRQKRKQNESVRIKMPRDVAEIALRLSVEDDTDLHSWVTALVLAEASRRVSQSGAEAVA